jgi:hypothetical protein
MGNGYEGEYDPVTAPVFKTDVTPTADFKTAHGENNWAIRFGTEPIDLHLGGKGTGFDKFVEDDLGITAGVGSVFNHNYIEFGRMNDAGEFETVKRVHGLGLDENWEMTGGGRLVGMVIDGKHTPFSADPIQKDDPHATKPNQLQHADETNWLSDNATEIVFQGTEQQVMQMYAATVAATIEVNSQGNQFGMMGQNSPNSNSFNTEMKQKINEIGKALGLEIGEHDAGGWDIGSGFEMNTRTIPIREWAQPEIMAAYIDNLEKTAADQLKRLQTEGIDTDLTKPAVEDPAVKTGGMKMPQL